MLSMVGPASDRFAAAQTAEEDPNPNRPLAVGADVGYVPFVFRQADGKIVGFSVDLGEEIARRLGRPGFELIEQSVANIFSGLGNKRYEFIVAPVALTAERARQMAFTEPYLSSGFGFLTASGEPDMKTPDDLKGRTVAVARDSPESAWAAENAPKIGFEVQRFDRRDDAIGAVITGRVQVAMADLPSALYTANQVRPLKVGLSVLTGRAFALPFRNDDVAFRNRVETILEALKKDRTLIRLHEKWFGAPPVDGGATLSVFEGFGPPGLPGHVAR
jgi:polar amino acid transport system substrate-binding protein